MNAAYEHAATNIMKKAPTLSMKDRMEWRAGLGVPSTRCTLPSGDVFDTKTVAGFGKHAANNQLKQATDIKPHIMPGMKSNLEIDWANQSTDFIEYVKTVKIKKRMKTMSRQRKKKTGIQLYLMTAVMTVTRLPSARVYPRKKLQKRILLKSCMKD